MMVMQRLDPANEGEWSLVQTMSSPWHKLVSAKW